MFYYATDNLSSIPLLDLSRTFEHMDSRRLLATNIRKLMDADPDRDSQAKVAKAASLAQKTISNVLQARGPAPTLATLELLGKAFGVPPWALMHPTLGLPLPTGSEQEFHRKLESAMTALKALRKPPSQ